MFLFDDLIHLRKECSWFSFKPKKIIFFKNHGFQVVSYLEYFFYLIFKLANSVYQVKCGVKVTPV
jgi:hypothetical protein